MIGELQAILDPDLVPMLLVNGVAALLGVCFMIVALSTDADVRQPAPRATARV